MHNETVDVRGPRAIWRDRLWEVVGVEGPRVRLRPLPGAQRDQLAVYDDPLLDTQPTIDQLREYCPACGRRKISGPSMICDECGG
jgi:hypothetical protein